MRPGTHKPHIKPHSSGRMVTLTYMGHTRQQTGGLSNLAAYWASALCACKNKIR